MQMSDLEIKDEKTLYDGVFQVKSFKVRFQLFSGEWSPWLVREQISRQDAVAVLLYDPNTDQLVMVEQLRIGAIRKDTQRSPWMLEIVAGLIDDEEDPSLTAVREVTEEAQCRVKRLIPIVDFYPSPGGFTEMTRIYCGIVDSTQIGMMGGLAHEHEDIRIHVLSADDILTALERALLVSSASTVIALLWLKDKRNNQSAIFKNDARL